MWKAMLLVQNYFDTSYVCLMFVYSLSKLQPTYINNLLLTSLSLHIIQKKLIMHLVICSYDLGFSTWQHAILLS
jgi:hypothetical protein